MIENSSVIEVRVALTFGACESVALVVLFFRGSWDAQASMVVESQDSNGELEALWTGSSTLPQLHHSGLLSIILSG